MPASHFQHPVILGIETSCDETSAAVVAGGILKSNVVSSQMVHAAFGGVVPEFASRAHEQLIAKVVSQALLDAGIKKQDLTHIAVTQGPGLIGAVLVGLAFAKALGYGLNLPVMGMNHVEAHLLSAFIDDGSSSFASDGSSSFASDGSSSFASDGSSSLATAGEAAARYPSFPFLGLVVSGGHTMLVRVESNLTMTAIGKSIDDAAGEAFDKVGKMLELGYPAGPVIDRLSQTGDETFHKFPRAFTGKGFEQDFRFSFSGLKTAVANFIHDKSALFIQTHLADICASFQAAVVEVLVAKTVAAASLHGIRDVALAGGVSANRSLRAKMQAACAKQNLRCFVPSAMYSTDNAAMIATLAHLHLLHRPAVQTSGYDLAPFASLVL